MPKVICYQCKKEFRKESKRVNESLKRNWKFYCSPNCLKKSKYRRQILVCSNPDCHKKFERINNEIISKSYHYCSHLCSNIMTSKIRFNHSKISRRTKHCANPACHSLIRNKRKYCSNICQGKVTKISGEAYKSKVISEIKNFYNKIGRIPIKKEIQKLYRPARRAFGSWNHAIQAAGFDPNPVLFAKKYIANDGHKCDSLAEKIIDDWLFARNISHQINVPYKGTKMTADFEVNGTLVEFFGLRGQLKSYDRLADKKEQLIKDKNLKVISLYPEDLFPKNQLHALLKSLL